MTPRVLIILRDIVISLYYEVLLENNRDVNKSYPPVSLVTG